MVNFFDIFVVIVTLGLAIAGFREGLFRGIIKLLGFIITIVVLVLLAENIITACHSLEKIPPEVSVPLAFIGIFILSIVLIHFLAEILYKVIKVSPIRFIDSGLGCLFGIVKAFFLNGVLAVLLSFSSQGSFFNNQYTTSQTAGMFKTFLYETIPFIKSTLSPIYQLYMPTPEEQNNEQEHEDYSPENLI